MQKRHLKSIKKQHNTHRALHFRATEKERILTTTNRPLIFNGLSALGFGTDIALYINFIALKRIQALSSR
jgi:hypothetical protein